MNIITATGYIVISLLMLGFFYLGYLYIKGTKDECEKNNTNQSFNKQEWVKQNRNVFGINDHECNDIKHVYTVSPERMGF